MVVVININDSTKRTKKIYDRYATFYTLVESIFPFKNWRKETITSLSGNILEIGVGTGANFKYYSKKALVTGIDISDGMLEKAVIKIDQLNKEYVLAQMDAQNLQFAANTFDYVVATFVLCSVPNPIITLKEVQRVLKPNGVFISIDHVLSKKKIIAGWQHIHNPITRTLLGFNVNRDTRKNIAHSDLSLIKDEKLGFYDVFRRFTCQKGKNR